MAILPSGFELRLLDHFELRAGGCAIPVTTGSQRLVIFLALHRTSLPRGHVAGMLWPDVPTDRAGANLRASIWRVPPNCRAIIDVTGRHISLVPSVAVDFCEAVALAQRLINRSDPCEDRDLGAPARSMLSSELIPACYDEWVLTERERFRQLRLHALDALCDRLTVKGRYGEAVDAGLAAVCAEPLRESGHRAVIKAHLAEGNGAEAHRQYDAYRKVLRAELGVEPSWDLRDLILRACEARRSADSQLTEEAVRAHTHRYFLTHPASRAAATTGGG